MNNFIELKNRDVVKVSPRMLNKDYKKNILNILRNRYEGICSKFGYIKHNSIRLLDVSKGTIEMSTFHGYVLFDVEFIASICNPTIGSVVKCKVKNINIFGILCTSGIIENGVYQNILNIIIPKQDTKLVDNKQIIESVSINDDVNVEILGKKYILNNKNINIFGKIIDTTKEDVKTELDNNKLNLDELDDNEENDTEELLDEDNEEENEEEENDDKSDTQSNNSDDEDDVDDDDINDMDDETSTVLSEDNDEYY